MTENYLPKAKSVIIKNPLISPRNFSLMEMGPEAVRTRFLRIDGTWRDDPPYYDWPNFYLKE